MTGSGSGKEDGEIRVRWAMKSHRSILYVIEECCEGDVAQATRLIRKHREGPLDWRYTEERLQDAIVHHQAKQAAAVIQRSRYFRR